MVSHGTRWRSTFSRRRSPARSRWCSRVRALTRSSPATTGTRLSRTYHARERSTRTPAVFFDRPDPELRKMLEPSWLLSDDPSFMFVADHFDQPGAPTTLDAALRLDTRVMLVDDPVKRVDNMTMAWGLEARVPFLPRRSSSCAAGAHPN